MRRLTNALFLCIVLGLISQSARAAVDEVLLGYASALQPITFIGNSAQNDVSVTLGACSGGTCTLDGFGLDIVTVSGSTSFNTGSWSITSNQNDAILLTDDGNGLWTMNGPSLVFSYGFGSTVLLAGNINLATVQQSPDKSSAVFQNNSLTQTTGSLAGVFGSGSIINWAVSFAPPIDFSQLIKQNGTVSVYSALGDVVPAPEPGTLLLIGSALVLVGGMLRRQSTSASKDSAS